MKKYLFFSLITIVLFFGFFLFQYFQFFDGKIHIVFCDVGQGDAIFITTPSRKHILVDGGPDESVLACLSSHMPFWERTIDVMMLSHPHADHLHGLVAVLDRYSVRYFATEPLDNKTEGFALLKRNLKRLGVPQKSLLAGHTIRLGDGVVLKVLGPTKTFLDKTSPRGTIGESAEFGSLIERISYKDFDVLLTGDSQVLGMSEALEEESLPSIEVLQVPHHGSRFGLDKGIVEEIHSQVAVFSVGKNNYGHPAPSILTILQNTGTKYYRTDLDGDVEIVSDGKRFWVK